MKICTKCGEKKTVQDFYLTRYGTPNSECKKCHNARGRAHYVKKYARPAAVTVSPDASRTCTKCAETKTAADFGRVKNSPDGLRRECKTCRVARERARYAANASTKRQYGRNWNALNRDRLRASKVARKKAVKQATPSWLTAIQRAQIGE